MYNRIVVLGVFAVLLATLSCAIPADAALPGRERVVKVKGEHEAEVHALREAYQTLAKADHDYEGHRKHAMRAIEAACDELGHDIRGDGAGQQSQTVSDEELHKAHETLKNARNMAVEKNQKKVARHIEKAIEELGIALKIR